MLIVIDNLQDDNTHSLAQQLIIPLQPGYKPRNYLSEYPLDSVSRGPPLVPYSTPNGQAPQEWTDGYAHK